MICFYFHFRDEYTENSWAAVPLASARDWLGLSTKSTHSASHSNSCPHRLMCFCDSNFRFLLSQTPSLGKCAYIQTHNISAYDARGSPPWDSCVDPTGNLWSPEYADGTLRAYKYTGSYFLTRWAICSHTGVYVLIKIPHLQKLICYPIWALTSWISTGWILKPWISNLLTVPSGDLSINFGKSYRLCLNRTTK